MVGVVHAGLQTILIDYGLSIHIYHFDVPFNDYPPILCTIVQKLHQHLNDFRYNFDINL